jgi:hypothetical protein
MPFSIKDSEMIVGTLSLDDVAGLPTNDTITGATWATTDIADAGTDVTIATGDSSSGTNDGALNKVTVTATGTALGTVSVTGTITTASGASLLVADTGTVNGGPAATVGIAWGTAAPKTAPAPAAATTTDTKATTVTADGTTSPVSDPASNVATVPEQAPPVA